MPPIPRPLHKLVLTFDNQYGYGSDFPIDTKLLHRKCLSTLMEVKLIIKSTSDWDLALETIQELVVSVSESVDSRPHVTHSILPDLKTIVVNYQCSPTEKDQNQLWDILDMVTRSRQICYTPLEMLVFDEGGDQVVRKLEQEAEIQPQGRSH